MLLVVVLTMIVALTIGLSIASRTVTNLKISRQNEESERAFQAAEAGISQVLETGTEINFPNLSNEATYSTNVVRPGESPGPDSFMLNGGELVDQASGIDVWLAKYPDFTQESMSGTIRIFWGTDNHTTCDSGQPGNTVKPALEVAILSGNKLDPTLTKYIYDGCLLEGINRVGGTGAKTPQAYNQIPPGSSIKFNYRAQIDLTSGLIMKVIPIYNSTKIFILGTNTSFPEQGTVVESTGTSGETTRKILYYSSHPQIPIEMFPYSLLTQ
jgi:hypothetical protein